MVFRGLRCLFFTCCLLVSFCLVERGEADGFYASLGWGESVADFGVEHLKVKGITGSVMGPRKSELNAVKYSRNTFSKGIGGVGSGEFGDKYRPVYTEDFGLSGSFGYRFGNLGVEIEGSEQQFRPSTAGYKIEGNAVHFAFTTGERGVKEEVSGFVGENPGMHLGLVLLNGCYSGLRLDEKNGIYTCLGLGLAAADYLGGLGRLRALWDAKIGVELQFTKNLAMFGEVYYRGFGVLPGRVRVFSVTALEGVDTLLSSGMDVSYVGNACGVRYLF
ncbi:P44/Msp2 family outer membrane protein [Anaplasma phagocytophilum]|uniref:P44/Msp2 family outer membrane protein n=1 Tax=Anaplasma phagocytophilum TaxID=948 RepID=UPI00200D0A2E|nr:P44/Msp2 family outer membrane protein [Anaplasma phagocytophilum]UQD54361.1 P44/Msp2 family outer membrane protein [Anaplasma phagocytophilum]